MDEDYILVPKDEVSNLKAEIKKLKEELNNKPEIQQEPQVDINEFVGKLVEVLHEESKKERELILENLNEIKDLNKSTLDNLLTKTEKLDNQLEDMVDSISSLVDTLSNVADKFSKNQNFDELINKIKNSQNTNLSPEVMKKLDEIDVFMQNLRILLSYVKPNDLTIKK